MKLMRNISFYVLPLLSGLSMLFFSSCQKEQYLGSAQFQATIEGCASQQTKTTLVGTMLQWNQGDQIAIVSGGQYGVYQAQPDGYSPTVATFTTLRGDAGDGPYYAVYPASAANIRDEGWRVTITPNSVILPTVQNSPDGSLTEFPMYAQSSTNQLQFKNLCGVLKLHLQKGGVNIKQVVVMVGEYEYLNGIYSVSCTGGIPSLQLSSNGTNMTTLNCVTAQDISGGKDFYIALPPDTYSNLLINIIADDGSICSKRANIGITISRSQYTLVSFSESDLNFLTTPQGAAVGLFSVGPATQAWFSQGNLQYTTSGTHRVADGSYVQGTFRFAEHQYDMIGAANANVSSTCTGWIDLFGWGTSGYNGMNPYMTSTTWNDYPRDWWPDDGNGLLYPYDWGRYNSISNGGNAPDRWVTLSSSEWDYLLNWRANASTKKGIGMVNNVQGLILLPDHWTLPVGLSFTSGFSSTWGDWSVNNYSASQWQQMEQAGAVFLPAAGYRNGATWCGDGVNTYSCGHYWTSSRNYMQDYVICVEFNSQGLSGSQSAASGGAGGYGGAFAQAVRLVQYVHR